MEQLQLFPIIFFLPLSILVSNTSADSYYQAVGYLGLSAAAKWYACRGSIKPKFEMANPIKEEYCHVGDSS